MEGVGDVLKATGRGAEQLSVKRLLGAVEVLGAELTTLVLVHEPNLAGTELGFKD